MDCPDRGSIASFRGVGEGACGFGSIYITAATRAHTILGTSSTYGRVFRIIIIIMYARADPNQPQSPRPDTLAETRRPRAGPVPPAPGYTE